MDALRVLTMIMVIAFHSAMAYTTTRASVWYVHDINTNPVFSYLNLILHSVNMPFFFFVAGFFTKYLHDRYPLKKLIENRLWRVAIPFLFGLVILIPYHLTGLSMAYFQYHTLHDNSVLLLQPHMMTVSASDFTLPHILLRFLNPEYLWFLYYLLLIYVVSLGIYLLAQHPHLAKLKQYFPAVKDTLQSTYGAIILIIGFIGLLYLSGVTYLITPEKLGFDVDAFCIYSLFFVYGLSSFPDNSLISCLRGQRKFISVLLLFTYCAYLSLQYRYLNTPALDTVSLQVLIVILHGLCTWGSLFFVVGLLMDYCNKPNRVIHYLADASYWKYLISLQIVVVCQYLLIATPLPSGVKFLIVLSVSLGIALLSYHLFVRFTWLGKVLGGPKRTTSTVSE
tara:strand:- start:15833 stop:17014 length:1182 start_codon:yes stop_codon:yes gene_type:complete